MKCCSCWSVPCRWLSADGSEQVGQAWGSPQEVLRLPQGVQCVSAGLHSSAAIDRDGQLWLWGKVISQVSSNAAHRLGQKIMFRMLLINSLHSHQGSHILAWNALPVSRTQALLTLQCVSAGLHSSAAIDQVGQLWLWGKVISQVYHQ